MYSWISVLFHQFLIISVTDSWVTLGIFLCRSQSLLVTVLVKAHPFYKHPSQTCISHLTAFFMKLMTPKSIFSLNCWFLLTNTSRQIIKEWLKNKILLRYPEGIALAWNKSLLYTTQSNSMIQYIGKNASSLLEFRNAYFDCLVTPLLHSSIL